MIKFAGRTLRRFVGGFVATLTVCVGFELLTGESTMKERVSHIVNYEREFLKEVAIVGGIISACAGFGLDMIRCFHGRLKVAS